MSYLSERPAAAVRARGRKHSFVHSIVLLSIFVCIALLAAASLARAGTQGLVGLNDVNSGALLLNSTVPGKYVPAPLLATDVKIDVTGPIARTRVTQHFINPGEGWVEGKYIFPLPENSAVDIPIYQKILKMSWQFQ